MYIYYFVPPLIRRPDHPHNPDLQEKDDGHGSRRVHEHINPEGVGLVEPGVRLVGCGLDLEGQIVAVEGPPELEEVGGGIGQGGGKEGEGDGVRHTIALAVAGLGAERR